MIARYECLHRHPVVFRALTGVSLAEFDTLIADVLPQYAATERLRHTRPARQRAIGAGPPFRLEIPLANPRWPTNRIRVILGHANYNL